MGIGYHFSEADPKMLLIFNKKKTLHDTWRNIIKWWPDDEIRTRFVEKDDSFDYVLYGKSNILRKQWVFLKSLKSSIHYKKFKTEYDGTAYLGFALYMPTNDSYELVIFDYKKKITDIRFLSEQEAEQDSVVLIAKKAQIKN